MPEQRDVTALTLWQRLRRWWSGGPCDRCGVEGGTRWNREEKVGNRIVKRSLCDSCSKFVFFYGWRDLPAREWVR